MFPTTRSIQRLLSLFVLPLAAIVLCVPACAHHRPPNVLVVVMDTTRADRLSLDGYPRSTTPELSAFAKDGVTFLNAWTPAGWTGPAHASLFTGLRPIHHGFLLGNQEFLGLKNQTLAEVLAGHGYRTACFTNNALISPEYGLTRGFQIVESVLDQPEAQRRSSLWAHRRALEVAKECRSEKCPFFIFVNDMEDHLAYDPPKRFSDRFLPADATPAQVRFARGFNFPSTVQILFGDLRLAPADWRVLSSLYDADLAWLDNELGRFLHSLRKEGLLDNTLLVITADHGELIGEHGLCDHKENLYSQICHIPLLIRYPGTFDGGERVQDLVRLEDLFPTILTVCHLPVPSGLDGRSLTSSLGGRISRAEHGVPSPLMLATVREYLTVKQIQRMRYSVRAVVDGRYHLIRWSTGREELYDLAKDPGETIDLSRDQPDVVRRLAALLDP